MDNGNGSTPASPFTQMPEYQWQSAGLTKREMFAMAAMQGLVSANAMYGGRTDDNVSLSRNAVQITDALLKELSK